MSDAKKTILCLLVLPLVIFLWSNVVFAENFSVENEQLYKIDDSGKKTLLENVEVSKVEIKDGADVYYATLDPESNSSLGKIESGLYFFDGKGKSVSFLKKEQPEICFANFSPDGKKFILDCGTYVDRSFELYEFNGLVKKKDYYGCSQLSWLDPHRFVFTLIDETHKARTTESEIPGWLSVVVYDSAVDLLTPVAEATPTDDFLFEAVDVEANTLVINKYHVDDEKLWSQEDKIDSESIEKPIPAAG